MLDDVWRADIEWPEADEALSDNARNTIESLLSNDPQHRPDAVGQNSFGCLLYLVLYFVVWASGRNAKI